MTLADVRQTLGIVAGFIWLVRFSYPIFGMNGGYRLGEIRLKMPVTFGENLRINKQLCWVARRAAGQGGD